MRLIATLGILLLAACSSGPSPMAFDEAQGMVDEVATRHSDLVRLTIHAVPTGQKRSRVIASNVASKLDQWSDPEDLEAMQTGEPVTLMEGDDLDYTVPVMQNGKAVAAVGVTVKGSDKEAMLASAQCIARELIGQITSGMRLPW